MLQETKGKIVFCKNMNRVIKKKQANRRTIQLSIVKKKATKVKYGVFTDSSYRI